ncbi:hypothetical protein QE152_g23473 [Popillia japonica]|uniref:Uncharacterized protein n=1 Tax=Popillia japonica TaxID=7064 RepID=A0AAW1KI95_POPJA
MFKVSTTSAIEEFTEGIQMYIWLQWVNELSYEEKDYDDESEDEEQHENQDETSEHDSDSLQECSETEEYSI